MSSDENITEVSSKSEARVLHCCLCGIEFGEIQNTNVWLKCENCDNVFRAIVK